MRPLLRAYRAMFFALLFHSEKRGEFKDFLGHDISRQFWWLMYLAAKEPNSSSAGRFEIFVGNLLKKTNNYRQVFNKDIPFEKNWFNIVRYVLEYKNDQELCYHFSQLTRCICCLYRPMFHREGFYEFGPLVKGIRSRHLRSQRRVTESF